MNNNKRFFSLFVFTLFFSISTIAQDVMYEGENNGVLMLSVSEYNIKKKNAIPKAIEDAYFQILFRGIPGSQNNKKALLGTDENAMNEQRQYYENMLHRNRLYSFVTFSSLSYYRRKEAIVKISINVNALIADLERNNLYRRFGLF